MPAFDSVFDACLIIDSDTPLLKTVVAKASEQKPNQPTS